RLTHHRSSRAASASTRSTTSVPRRRVFHTVGAPSVDRMLLATIGSSTKAGTQIVVRKRSSRPPLACRERLCYILNHMVQYMTTRLDTSFAALSDATRRGVLEQLGRADASITDLAEKFHMTLTGMKKHVGVLEQAGL